MSELSFVDKQNLEDLFEMRSGFVLDFSDRTFSDFFQNDFGIDINSKKYLSKGTSKANKLRTFWEIEPNQTVGLCLQNMLSLWRYKYENDSTKIASKQYKACQEITNKLLIGTSDFNPEKEFIRKRIEPPSFLQLNLEPNLIPFLERRYCEIEKCLEAKVYLGSIFLCGSLMEGLFLSFALRDPKTFNTTSAAPKDKQGKVKMFYEWSLANFIDAAKELGLIDIDVQKFGHTLRDFRNYIHPYAQMSSSFHPDQDTAEMCYQVVKAAISDLSRYALKTI